MIQRRLDGSVDFDQPWSAYKYGFGTLTRDMWLGLDKLNRITSRLSAILYINLKTVQRRNMTFFAEYEHFAVQGEDANYALQIGNYEEHSTAGDSLTPTGYYLFHNLDGVPFTTKDRDNDARNTNCAVEFGGGWWHRECFLGNLNGLFWDPAVEQNCHDWYIAPKYMSWYTVNDCYGDVVFSEMKLHIRL